MILQPIVNIAEICAQKGIKNFVLSPGSRCAPLTIALVRHPAIKTYTISDERSAAFIGLGIAQQTKNLVGLVCTSGSAGLNYFPAVAEAYYQEIPLLILTADRPPEWLNQQDGQTLHQYEVYGKHVKGSFQLTADYTHADSVWFIERTINEAINLANAFPQGPVHVNVPIREPFYPNINENVSFDKHVKIIENITSTKILSQEIWQTLTKLWEQFDKKLIVVGQHDFDPTLLKALKNLQESVKIPVIGDVLANIYPLPTSIGGHDVFLMGKNEVLKQNLQPDLLITCGKSILSKNLKNFLRNSKPQQHWHIQMEGNVADSFQTLTHILPVKSNYFFQQILEEINLKNEIINEAQIDYCNLWRKEEGKAKQYLQQFFNPSSSEIFSEFEAVKIVLDQLPESSILHLANSMPVRYANMIGLEKEKNIEIFANRGTSGIDGSTSTAMGAALMTEKIVTLITGDVAFFYDNNAFWHNYLPKNLRIILLNNHGGGIFRILEGSGSQPELAEYFETSQKLTAENLAKSHGMSYFKVEDALSLQNTLNHFFEQKDQPQLLEITTESIKNTEIFKKFKSEVQNLF